MANLVLLDGPLFGEKTHVMRTFVAGDSTNVYEPVIFGFKGPCTLKCDAIELAGNFDPETKAINFETLAQVVAPVPPTAPPAAPAAPPAAAPAAAPVPSAADAKPAEVKPAEAVAAAPAKPFEPKKFTAEHVDFDLDRVGFTLPGEALSSEGLLRCTAVRIGDRVEGVAQTRDGKTLVFTLTKRDVPKPADAKVADAKPADAKPADPKAADAKPGDAKPAEAVAAAPAKKTEDPLAFLPAVTPLGEYGLEAPPASQAVLVKNATIWTCGPAGTLKSADLLVVDGKVKAVGSNVANVPAGALVIDGTGKHVTPGLIDCHSHTGIEGGVNEGTKNDTAECRINDCIDPDAIGWYRELAGGLTAANQLHGSANPIGGQNSVVKLKWGNSANDFRIPGAIPGIKFALGENVTRPRGRYPNTRMGVEALLRDSFREAREYAAKQRDYAALTEDAKASTMPPRRDLQLEALAEILEGKRLVHCHSYRQDEILMLLRLAEEFNFRVGTFQHVLEGYKVADLIAKHGAGASTFSDWWAYKMEVMDAVPFNGSLMHDVGVVVSFNSDSDEMARRLNMEAAKAVKYGGCDPVEALKFVTINPAKQLKIDQHMGSLEAGKDGDFVVWSGEPLSGFTLAESTWIEGACYFDRAKEQAMRERDAKLRARLLELAVAEGEKTGNLKTIEPPKAEPAKDAKPAPTTLLTRMMDLRREALVEQVRRGRDPESMGPGDCGCGGSSEGWRILLEEGRQ
ncbi:MAG: amidohydrolase [Planctomycetes bacterium]|nr:amidohydrolase [Planctomycetota bacterium]